MAEYIIETDSYYLRDDDYNEFKLNEETKLIRCKDCKFSHILQEDQWPAKHCPELVGRMYCTQWSDGNYGDWTEPEGFCHKGTKR